MPSQPQFCKFGIHIHALLLGIGKDGVPQSIVGFRLFQTVGDFVASDTIQRSRGVEVQHNAIACNITIDDDFTAFDLDFHDVPDIAKWIIEHTEEIGEAIAKGTCNYYGVTYKPAVDEKDAKIASLEKQVAELKAKIVAAQNALK